MSTKSMFPTEKAFAAWLERHELKEERGVVRKAKSLVQAPPRLKFARFSCDWRKGACVLAMWHVLFLGIGAIYAPILAALTAGIILASCLWAMLHKRETHP